MSDYEKMTNEQPTEEMTADVQATENQMPENQATEETAYEMPVAEEPVMDVPVETPVYEEAGRDVSMPAGEKKSPVALVLAIVGIALVAIIVIAVGIFSGAFMSKKDKVVRAIANTFDVSSKMVDEYTEMCAFLADEYTMGMEFEVEDSYMDMQLAVADDEMQLSGDISVEDVPEIEFLAAVTDSQLKAQIPMISDYVFTYDYTAEKNGYLVSEMGEETVKVLDMLCEMMYSSTDSFGNAEEFAKIIKEEYDSLEFEDAEKKEYEVDGTSRKCTAYKTTITEDNVVALVDALEASYPEDYMELMAEMDADMGEMFDEMRDELAGMEDIELVFYIYKNKLVCLGIEVDDDEAEILFDNEDDMLGIVMQEDDEVVMELDGYVDGDDECYDLIVEGTEVMHLAYNRKNGDFELVIEDSVEGSIAMRGSMKAESDSAVIEFTEVEASGETVEMLCNLTITKGATLEEFEGEELDLGNATEEEIMEVVMGMSSLMY